jgi:hypothetical protein
MKLKRKTIAIFSDSMSSLYALKSHEIRSFLVQDTIFKLNSLSRFNSVHLQWTRAHIGTLGNERADVLAKEGALCIGPTRYFQRMSTSRSKKLVRHFFMYLWQARWTTDPDCRQTRWWYPVVNPKKSAQILNLCRAEAGLLIQVWTGFNNLNYHSWNKDEITTDLCRLCLEESEQFIHLVSECPAVTDLRLEHFGPFGPKHHWDISDVLKFIKTEVIEDLINTRSVELDAYYNI